MPKIQLTTDLIEQAIAETPTMAQAAIKLGVTFGSFKRHAIAHGLYVPNRGAKGTQKKSQAKYSLDDMLKLRKRLGNGRLKQLLYSSGLKKEECEDCGLKPFWNGKKLVLQLDHRDGDPTNNALENLAIVCPNCHSQTPTFCRGQGKNGSTALVAK